MSEINPNAPPGFVWMFLEIDIPVCRDFIGLEEMKHGREMSNAEAQDYIASQFHFGAARAKQIIDTIKGEITSPTSGTE